MEQQSLVTRKLGGGWATNGSRSTSRGVVQELSRRAKANHHGDHVDPQPAEIARVLSALHALARTAELQDEVNRTGHQRLDAVAAVGENLVHGKPVAREAVTVVVVMCLDALESVRKHCSDPSGVRWSNEEIEGACVLLLWLGER